MALTSATKDTPGKYELIILHPKRILPGGFSVVIKHPTTNHLVTFYPSSDGFLHEGPLDDRGTPTGPRLPAFSSRGDRMVKLNPILVNDAAAIRLRRLDRLIPGWRENLHKEAQGILREVHRLREAVLWRPGRSSSRRISTSGSLPLDVPDLQSPAQHHQPPPLTSAESSRSSLRPFGEALGGFPTMDWEDAEKLIHTGNFPL